MLIGGLQKTSLIDYPEKVASVVFTAGCNFRCGFCHNPDLVIELKPASYINEDYFFDFLKRKGNIIEGVVITGGEPTIQEDLLFFLERIKMMGFLIKLDTNGSRPEVIEKIIEQELADYFAMDIKAPLPNYQKIVRIKVDPDKILRSIKLIKESGIDYEFRSTIMPFCHNREDVKQMAMHIAGARLYYLQKFLPAVRMNDMAFRSENGFSLGEMGELASMCSQYVDKCLVR